MLLFFLFIVLLLQIIYNYYVKKQFTYFLQILLLAGIYYATGKFGLMLDAVGGFASLIWLPTGISLAALLLLSPRLWPGIFLGAFFVNFTSGAPLLPALGIASGNTLEALTAYYLLRKIHFQLSFERVRDTVGFIIFAGWISTWVSATIGTLSLLFGGTITFTMLPQTWISWWVGDMLSNLVVTPLLLMFFSKTPEAIEPKRRREFVLVWSLIGIIGILVFTDFFGLIKLKTSAITYLIFPPIIWMALRFSQRAVAASILMFSVLSIWGTLNGLGPFVRERLSESLLLLQSFIAVFATTTMILSAAVTERRILERQKDDFMSVTSHELKTPLTIIKAYIQLLEKRSQKKQDAKTHKYVETVHVYVDKMTRLINDLLDIRKIEAGTLTLEKERFDIKILLDHIVQDIHFATKRMIILKTNSAHKQLIAGDKARLSQVFINLLTNAIKYSPRNKKVLVDIKSNHTNVTISVQDFGVGITKNYQNRIFDRFFRIVEAKRNAISGFGLGLYIASEIVKQHEGKIWVESTKGKGSTFYVSLPIQ